MFKLNGLYQAAALISIFLASSAPSMQSQQDGGNVSGYIICNDGNTPARRAQVALMPIDIPAAKTVEAVTDFSGYYEIPSVRPGTYIVSVRLFPGYLDDAEHVWPFLKSRTEDERKKIIASLPQVTVKPGESAHKNLVIQRGAAITGHVMADLGGTPGTIRVTATLVPDDAATTDSKQASDAEFSRFGMTDDRGAYRIAGLLPGTYRLFVHLTEAYFNAKIGDGKNVTLEPQRQGIAELTVYAPDVFNLPDAKLIKVSGDDEITDADITIPFGRLHSIGGMITRNGAPAGGVVVALRRPNGSVQAYNAVALADGSYRFDLLPPGDYQVEVTGKAPGASIARSVKVHLDESDVLDAQLDISGLMTSPVGFQSK